MQIIKQTAWVLIISLLVTLFTGMVPTFADQQISGDWKYTPNGDGVTCTINKYTGTDTEVDIPSTLGVYTVTELAVVNANSWEYVFSNANQVTSVTIPDTVTNIGANAFLGCSKLSSVTIPSSVTSIGGGAFGSCGLTSVTIPSSVTSIGNNAFSFCEKLSSVAIPPNVTSIGNNTFHQCINLRSVTIPNSVTSIGIAAFSLCEKLSSVTIPSNVTSIGAHAFDGSGLTSVTIPSSVTSIESRTFSDCGNLESVTIPANVKSIGGSAFFHCPNLKSVTIPSSVASIGIEAFSRCTSLGNIYFDGRPISVASNAFEDLSSEAKFYSLTGTSLPGITFTTPSSFDITTPPFQNGTITPSTVNGMAGETISLDIKPDPSYRLQPGSLSYTGDTMQIAINGSAFVMPNEPVTILGLFTEMDAPIISPPSVTSSAIKWTWTSKGGEGKYRYKLSKPSETQSTWKYLTVAELETSALNTGEYNLEVQEQYGLDDWSPSATSSFTLERDKPTMTSISPTGSDVSFTTNQLVLSFSETVTATSTGALTLTDGTDNYICNLKDHSGFISGTASNCKATLQLSAFVKSGGTALSLSKGKTYTLSVSAGAFTDASGNLSDARSESFATENLVTPVTPPTNNSGGSGSGTSRTPETPNVNKVLPPVVPAAPVAPTPAPTLIPETPTVEKPIKIKLKIDRSGNGTAKVTLADVQSLLDKTLQNKAPNLDLPLETSSSVKGLQLQIDPALVKALNRSGIKTLTFVSSQGSYSFDQKTLAVLEKQGDKGIAFNIERLASKTGLKPQTTFKVSLSTPGAAVRITVPYVLAKGEKAKDIRFNVMNAKGKEEQVKGVVYDLKTKVASFVFTAK